MAKTRTEIQAKYDAANRKTYSLKFNLNYDADIIKKLDSIESKNGYIRDLIRQDLARTCPVKSSVSVPFSEASLSILEEKASEKGISVPDLIALVVNEQLLRTCSDTASVPVSNKHKTPKQLLAYLKQYTKDYDGSMYELLNALTNEYMNS